MFKWLSKEQKNELNQLPIFKNVEYFDIQVGWFEEIKKIGLEIQEYCDKNNNPYPKITQIKTKFGEIRISYKNSNLINFNNFFEKINQNCEYCGSIKNVDIIIRDRCVLNLCEEHKEKNDVEFKTLLYKN